MNRWGFWLPPVHTICARCGYSKQALSGAPCGLEHEETDRG